MAEETVTNIEEQPIPPKQKLWSALSDAGYYTKPYGDFDKQFSSPDQINKLYGTLKAADYYTKSGDDFNSQFFTPEKKSPVGNASSNGVDLSGAGLNPFQSSQAPTDLAPVLPKNRPTIRTQQIKDAHSSAISTAQDARKTTPPPETQSGDRSVIDQIGQALYIPAIKQGFNDLIVSPMAGGTDFIDRTVDKAYKGITGEETPSWLRKKGFFHDINKQIQEEYDTRDKPKNMVSDIAEGVIGTLPLMASMYTGQAEASIAMKAPQLFGRLAKTLATTQGLTAYKDATKDNEGYLQSLEKGVQGAAKGGIEGQFMEAQMLVGGALGKGVANKLAERGLLKGGKAAKAVLHALSVGTVFGGTSAGEDLLQGKEINTDNALKQFGTGLAFELMPVAKGINEELKSRGESKKINDQAAQLAAVVNSASNLNGESAVRTLLTTPIEQIQQVHKDIPTGHEDLYADSIEKGAQAYEAKDNTEKKDLYTQQLALKTQGDIKMIADKVSDPKTLETLKNEIYDNEELSDAEVQDLHDKLDALAPEAKVVEPPIEAVTPEPIIAEQPITEPPTEPIIYEPATPSPETPADVQGQSEQPVSAAENSVEAVETPVEEVAPQKIELGTYYGENGHQYIIRSGNDVDGYVVQDRSTPNHDILNVPLSELKKANLSKTKPIVIEDSKPNPIRQKAIDAITHGIIGNGERKAKDVSPRFDLEMDTAEQKRAIRDITNGKYETAAAKKMIDKVSEFEAKGEYPIIEGDGGNAVRQRGATADEIQSHIDSAKQFKAQKLTEERAAEFNKYAESEHALTEQDFDNYENYRNDITGERASIARDAAIAEGEVQRPRNDKGASKPQNTGSEATQGESRAGDPLRSFADTIRKGKISKLSGFRAGTGFDVVWDGSLEVVASTIEGGAKIADAIEAGLKHIKQSDWYKKLDKKEDFDKQYKDHLSNEYAVAEKAMPAKNETNEAIAAELGINMDEGTKGKRTNEVIEAEASSAIKKGYDTPKLIDEILNEGHTATDTEVAILAKYRDLKYEEIKGQNERLESDGATMSKKDFQALMESNDASLNEMQDIVQAIRKTGSVSGSALRARQLDLQKETSLANMIATKRQALGGDKLTTEQLAEVTKRFSEMENIQKQLEARVKKVEADNAKLKADQTVKKVNSDRSAIRNATKSELATERSKIFENIRSDFEKIRKSGQAMSDIPYRREFAAIAKHMPALLRNLAQDGLIRIEDVVDNLYDTFKGDLPDITKRDVTDLIAGKYNEVKPTKNELQDNIRSLKTQAKLINEIADLEKGIKTAKPESIKKKNEAIEALRTRLKELNKESEPFVENKSLDALKKRIQGNIDKINKKIADGDFSKEEPKKPVKPDEEALNLRRKYDRIKQEWDIEVAKDALKQRSKIEKLKDDLLNIASLPRALKASLDFSAVLRQGLFATAGHPKEALTAFKEMFKQTFSEDNYKNWISDLKHSEYYDLMKDSDLYLSDKNDPKIIAREEEFTSNLADKIPVIGKAIQASERAYTGYLNVLRAGIFESQAHELIKRGYTFENNPDVFKGVAKVVNVLTGRGDIPDVLGGKSPKVLSNVLFSPRFMAARIQTLYLWADPRLPREAKVMAAKDIGATIAMGTTLLSLAALAGFKVNTDPRSTQFLKIQDKEEKGSTYYDILGGLPQYIKLLSQIATGKTISGTGKVTDLSAKRGKSNPWGQTRGDVELKFMRGKLSPVVGSAINLQEGKDVVGQPYNVWPDVPKEFIPLPYTDVQEAYKIGGIDNALKVVLPAQFGIGVSSY